MYGHVRKRMLVAVGCIGAMLASSASAMMHVIDFNDPLLEAAFFLDGEIVIDQPVQVVSVGVNGAAQVINPPASFTSGPHSGSAYLQSTLFAGVHLLAGDSETFDLTSIAIGEFSSFVSLAPVLVTGYAGNTIKVTHEISLDGNFDGPGGVPDFQTVLFDNQWTGLTQVTFDDGAYSLDDIEVRTETTIIPLPATWLLLVFGMSGLVRLSRNGRSISTP